MRTLLQCSLFIYYYLFLLSVEWYSNLRVNSIRHFTIQHSISSSVMQLTAVTLVSQCKLALTAAVDVRPRSRYYRVHREI